MRLPDPWGFTKALFLGESKNWESRCNGCLWLPISPKPVSILRPDKKNIFHPGEIIFLTNCFTRKLFAINNFSPPGTGIAKYIGEHICPPLSRFKKKRMNKRRLSKKRGGCL